MLCKIQYILIQASEDQPDKHRLMDCCMQITRSPFRSVRNAVEKRASRGLKVQVSQPIDLIGRA